MAEAPSIFTQTSAYSLAGVAGIGLLAHLGATALLPRNARWQDRFTFIWLVSAGYLRCVVDWLRCGGAGELWRRLEV
jgi:hypothetical protein